jgi:uncharacterized protein (UPF0333 family)
MFYKNKKGQAAMEFLMTYGWAILAAVIVVGVLWYMIGDPSNLVGNKVQLSSPFAAEGVAITSTAIQVEFRNGLAKPITVTSVKVADCVANVTSFDVAAGAIGVATANVSAGCSLTSGSRVTGDVTISYNTSVGGISQSGTGSITGQVP